MELLNSICIELKLASSSKCGNDAFRNFLEEVCLSKTPNSLFSTNAFMSASAKDLLDLVKLLVNHDFMCEWFLKSEVCLSKCDRSKTDKDAILNLTEIVYSKARIPQLPEDARFNESNYIKPNQCAKLGLEIFVHLVKFINNKEYHVKEEQKYNVIISSLLLCLEHSRKHLWSDETTIDLSKKIQDYLFESISFDDLLLKQSAYQLDAYFFTDMLKYIAPRLHSTNWKQNMPAIFVFLKLLENLKCNVDFDLLLPPLLLLMDDFEDDNIIIGLDGLNHFVKISSRFELKRFNRVEVIFDSLMKQLHTKNELLLERVLKNLILVLQTASSNSRDLGKEERCDKALIEVLKQMQIENLMNLRRTYCLHLTDFIRISNLACLKFSKLIFEVIFSYLECYDGSREICRTNVLLSLQQLMTTTWPRIHARAPDIAKSLIRLLHELSSSSYPGEETARRTLISSSRTCLRILHQIVPDIEDSIDCILKLNLEDSFRTNLQGVFIKNV